MIPRAHRIQHSRRKGAIVPPGAVYVGRPTIWGNPFTDRLWGHARSVVLHRRWIRGEIAALTLERLGFDPGEVAALDRKRCAILTRLHQLAGHNLVCWCPLTSPWCHAEIYLELAPSYAEYERFAA